MKKIFAGILASCLIVLPLQENTASGLSEFNKGLITAGTAVGGGVVGAAGAASLSALSAIVYFIIAIGIDTKSEFVKKIITFPAAVIAAPGMLINKLFFKGKLDGYEEIGLSWLTVAAVGATIGMVGSGIAMHKSLHK